jgi:hypothetical protein
LIDGVISQREVMNIGDLLGQEVVAVDKLAVYSNQCSDPELKAICKDLANTCTRHFDRLLQQVQVSGISSGVSVSQGTRFTGTWGPTEGYGAGYGYTEPQSTGTNFGTRRS